MFSKYVGVIESNESEVLAILEALCLFSASFHGKLIVESDFMNAVSWCVLLPRLLGGSSSTLMRLCLLYLCLRCGVPSCGLFGE